MVEKVGELNTKEFYIRYKLQQAIKLNKQEVRNNSKPHQRDMARMRRNVLKINKTINRK